MKIIKIIAAAGLAVGYCLGAYMQRGYWNPVSDAFMLSLLTGVYAVIVGAFRERKKDPCEVKSFEEFYDDLFYGARKTHEDSKESA